MPASRGCSRQSPVIRAAEATQSRQSPVIRAAEATQSTPNLGRKRVLDSDEEEEAHSRSTKKQLRQRTKTRASGSDSESDCSSDGVSSSTSLFAAPDDDDYGAWFAIKDIIGEKQVKRRRFYLVDWADNPKTGHSYSPSWIPAGDASADAVRAWKRTKKTSRGRRAPSPVLISSDPPASPPQRQPSSPAPDQAGSRAVYAVVQLVPDPQFDADEYTRVSEASRSNQSHSPPRPSQPHSQPAPAHSRQPHSQLVAPHSRQPHNQPAPAHSRQPHNQLVAPHSPATIPDSQGDSLETLGPLPASDPSAGVISDDSQAAAASSIPSPPPDDGQNGALHEDGPSHGQLRSLADWVSDETSELGLVSWELTPSQQFEQPFSQHRQHPSSDSLFLTQLPPSFDLLSQALSPPGASCSVVPDSTRPARTFQAAQIHSGHSRHSRLFADMDDQPSAEDLIASDVGVEEADVLVGPLPVNDNAFLDNVATPSEMQTATSDALMNSIDTSLLAMPGELPGGSSLASSAVENATIAPSALSLSMLPVPGLSTSPESGAEDQHMSEREKDESDEREDRPRGDHPREDHPREDDNPLASPTSANGVTCAYTVTLPLAANTRQRYIDVIMDSAHRQAITDFGDVFSSDLAAQPAPATVARIDEILGRLLDMTDLPPFFDSLPALSTEAAMKYAATTSPKYSFVYELLDQIGRLAKKVLIAARHTAILDYLEALVAGAGFCVRRVGTDPPAGVDDEARGETVVYLCSSGAAVPYALLSRLSPDIVIGFDHTARTSGLVAHYTEQALTGPRGADGLPKPVVLQLVAAYTLEHIDLQMAPGVGGGGGMDALERKNALVLCVLECLAYLQDTNYEGLPAKPHEAAKAFGAMFGRPGAVELDWKPVRLPEDVFDVYVSSLSQADTQARRGGDGEGSGEACRRPKELAAAAVAAVGLPSRKRPLDGADTVSLDTSKRPRWDRALSAAVPPPLPPIVENTAPVRLSDTLRAALGGGSLLSATDGPTVTVSLAQLEALAAKTVALQARLQDKAADEAVLAARANTLGRVNEAQAATIAACHDKLLAAVQDRGLFEAERDAAVKAATTAQDRLEKRGQALAELQARTAELERDLKEAREWLAGATEGEERQCLGAAKGEAADEAAASPPPLALAARVAALQLERQDLDAQLATLTRKLESKDAELGHARRAYQDASNAAADLSAENRGLAERVQALEHTAAASLRQIHETHARGEAAEHARRAAEAQQLLRERERDLEWAREELRLLKNGRRETRQQSVPHSPRISSSSGGGSASSSHSGGNGGGGPLSASSVISPRTIRGVSAAAAANGSRSNSPGTHHVAPTPGSGRWGHLRD